MEAPPRGLKASEEPKGAEGTEPQPSPGTSTPLFFLTHPGPRQVPEEMWHVLVPGQGVTFMGGSETHHSGLQAEFRVAFPRFLNRATPLSSDKSRSLCAITSLPAFKDSSSSNLPRLHPKKTMPGGPQAMSACEQPHLRCLCFWRREGGEGRIPCRGHGHKSHPFNQAGDTWLLHIRSHLWGQGHLPGVSHSSLGICPGGQCLARLLRAP